MARRPSFQFYPADWRANAKLRRCSAAARDVWVDIMAVFHDADEYGLVRWPLKDLARGVGAAMAQVRELTAKDVLKGSDRHLDAALIYVPRSGRRDGAPVTLIEAQAGPIWFSSRMVRDEYIRQHRGAATRFGAANDESFGDGIGGGIGASPMGGFGDGSSDSSSSSPSINHHHGENGLNGCAALLLRVCAILNVDPDTRPDKSDWQRQILAMREDGLSQAQIIAGAEAARRNGKTSLSYVRACAFNPIREIKNATEGQTKTQRGFEGKNIAALGDFLGADDENPGAEPARRDNAREERRAMQSATRAEENRHPQRIGDASRRVGRDLSAAGLDVESGTDAALSDFLRRSCRAF